MSRNYDARWDVSEEYTVRGAIKPDPNPGFGWSLFQGVAAIVLAFVALLTLLRLLLPTVKT